MLYNIKLKWIMDGVKNPLEENNNLFEAALNEFSSHSFRNASLNNIIKEAGMNKGSFYYRFFDKLDLYLSLLYRMGREKLEVLNQFEKDNAKSDFFDDIRQKAILGLRFAQKEPRYYSLWRRVQSEELSVREAIRNCFGDSTNNFMLEMIEKSQKSGVIRSDISAKTLAAIVSMLLERLDLLVSPDHDDDWIMTGIEEILDILKYGITAK